MPRDLNIGPIPGFSAIALTMFVPSASAAQEFPPEIQVDRLLVQAEREIDDELGRNLQPVRLAPGAGSASRACTRWVSSPGRTERPPLRRVQRTIGTKRKRS